MAETNTQVTLVMNKEEADALITLLGWMSENNYKSFLSNKCNYDVDRGVVLIRNILSSLTGVKNDSDV